jgi:alcohol oxidase
VQAVSSLEGELWLFLDGKRRLTSTRLANLDHNLTVLLIEGGENNLNNPWVFRPGIFPRNMKLDSKTATFYESRPSKWLGGRKAIVPCANILGGGSSINFMVSCITNLHPG